MRTPRSLPLREASLLAVFCLGALANGAGAPGDSGSEAWLTREELRAVDGTPLRLFEHRYSDVQVSPTPRAEETRRGGDYVAPPAARR